MSDLSRQLDALLDMSKLERPTKRGNIVAFDFTEVEERNGDLEYGQVARLTVRIYRPVRISVENLTHLAVKEGREPLDHMLDVARAYGDSFGELVEKVIEAVEDATATALGQQTTTKGEDDEQGDSQA